MGRRPRGNQAYPDPAGSSTIDAFDEAVQFTAVVKNQYGSEMPEATVRWSLVLDIATITS